MEPGEEEMTNWFYSFLSTEPLTPEDRRARDAWLVDIRARERRERMRSAALRVLGIAAIIGMSVALSVVIR